MKKATGESRDGKGFPRGGMKFKSNAVILGFECLEAKFSRTYGDYRMQLVRIKVLDGGGVIML